jgi:two-component system sensor histidine kinase GlrK
MPIGRPRSFLQLVLLGFALVTLPLTMVTIHATLGVDRLAAQSQQVVRNAVQAAQNSRELVEQIINMERHVRQYQVLGDKALFDAYATGHYSVVDLTSDLARLPLDVYQQRQLNTLIEKERNVFETLQQHPRQAVQSELAINEFVALAALAHSIEVQGIQMTERQLDALQRAAQQAQHGLLWKALAVIPVTVLVAIIFVALISRPIRQIRHAMQRLGSGDFTSTITVTGSRDMESLGQGLDWLRIRLLELEEAKVKFLGRVSHELKTPLAAIREGIELLADGVVGRVNPDQQEIIGILQDKSKHLRELIESLLNFSMAYARHATMTRQPVALHGLLGDVASDHKPVLLTKEVSLEISSTEVMVWGDDEKLRTVIDNLLSNAVKFSPDGSTILVSLERRDNCAVLDVIDSGPGIALHERDKVFNAFYQGDVPAQGYLKGNGLGLAIAREYLMAHHGIIELIDDRSSGAHFRVTLPVC